MTDRADRQDISELLVRYASGIDRRDWQLFRTVVTEDCTLDYGEIAVGLASTPSPNSCSRHTRWPATPCTGSPIRRSRSTATARTRVPIDGLIMASDNKSGVNAVGYYDDHVVRTDDGWRIARRRFTPVRVIAVGDT